MNIASVMRDVRETIAPSPTPGKMYELLPCRGTSVRPPIETGSNGLPQANCYVNVLRDAMAVDSLDPCGVYFGTSGGQVYASPDAGDHWAPIVRDLPPVLSVEVQTLS